MFVGERWQGAERAVAAALKDLEALRAEQPKVWSSVVSWGDVVMASADMLRL